MTAAVMMFFPRSVGVFAMNFRINITLGLIIPVYLIFFFKKQHKHGNKKIRHKEVLLALFLVLGQ